MALSTRSPVAGPAPTAAAPVPAEATRGRTVALALSGGVALGAYEAGTYAALAEAGVLPDWVAGVSIGAVTAAIIAGNPPERRVERLRAFWRRAAQDPLPVTTFWFGLPPAQGIWRRAYDDASAMQSLVLGSPGQFRPAPVADGGAAPALHDLAPLRETLAELVDFERLNGPDAPRLSIAATDLLRGERVVFDTRHMRLDAEHVLASCAMPPLLAPVEIEGRLLVDGGLTGNAPIDLVLDAERQGELLCLLVDLFSREGALPHSLGTIAERALAITFGHQTHAALRARLREARLARRLRELAGRLPAEAESATAALAEAGPPAGAATVLCLPYRIPAERRGIGALLDYAPATLEDRWRDGERDMGALLRWLAEHPMPRGDDELFVHDPLNP